MSLPASPSRSRTPHAALLALSLAAFSLTACAAEDAGGDLYGEDEQEQVGVDGSVDDDGGPVQCAAYPSCDPGDLEVDSPTACLQDDATCYERSLCGATIWCTGPVDQCAAYPSCDPGDLEVDSPSGCLQDDARCYERSVCGATIWCTGEGPGDGGPGPDGGPYDGGPYDGGRDASVPDGGPYDGGPYDGGRDASTDAGPRQDAGRDGGRVDAG